MLDRVQLEQLYPRAPKEHIDAISERADGLFSRFEISRRPIRLCCVLAQMGHESGGLTILFENLNYSAERMVAVWPSRFPTIDAALPFARNPEKLANTVYANRMGNGPAASGDGFRYRGRGYIQITGRDGYRQVGSIAGLPLESDPDLAADPEHALLVVCAFWQWKQLNALCDTARYDAVTRRINGGLNGFADRVAWLDKVRRILAQPLTLADHPDPSDVIAIQQALQRHGIREVGAADGAIGPRTISAITRFREKQGLPPGLIDTQLREALGLPAA